MEKSVGSNSKYVFFLLKSLSFILIVGTAILLWDFLEPSIDTLSGFMDRFIMDYKFYGMIFFVFLSAILSCFFVPRQVLSFVGGYAYGVFWGMFIVTIGAGIGCLITVLYTRFIAQKYIQKKIGFKIAWVEHLFSKNIFGMSLTIRIIPVGSNVILNMLVGVTKIPLIPFCFGSLIGFIPQNLIFAILGTGLRVDPSHKIILATIMYIIGILIGLYLYKIFRPKTNSDLKFIIKSIFKPNS